MRKIALHDHVLHRVHRFLQKIRVGRVGIVDVDFFVWLPYEIAELVREELACCSDIGRFAVDLAGATNGVPLFEQLSNIRHRPK